METEAEDDNNLALLEDEVPTDGAGIYCEREKAVLFEHGEI